jgi:hypothetical protein
MIVSGSGIRNSTKGPARHPGVEARRSHQRGAKRSIDGLMMRYATDMPSGRTFMGFSGSIGRRHLLQGSLSTLVSIGFASNARAEKPSAPARVVRISRASFAPEKYDDIKDRLDRAQNSLVPAIQRLHGCIHYFAAIDRESSSMVNVSVWQSVEDAKQMQTLAPMLALAEEFTREGVRFERPILNYETLWEA